MLLITITLIILSITSTEKLETESYCKAKTPFTLVQYGEDYFIAFFRNETRDRLKELFIVKDFKREPLNDRTDISFGTLKDTLFNTARERLPDAGIYPTHTTEAK